MLWGAVSKPILNGGDRFRMSPKHLLGTGKTRNSKSDIDFTITKPGAPAQSTAGTAATTSCQ